MADAILARMNAERQARDEAARRAADLLRKRDDAAFTMRAAEENVREARTKEEREHYEELGRVAKANYNEAVIGLLPEPEVHSTTEEELELFEKSGCSTRALCKLGIETLPVTGGKGRAHEETLSYVPREKFETETYSPSAGQNNTQAQLQTFIDQVLENPRAIGGLVSMKADGGEGRGHVIAVERKVDKDGKPYLNWYEEPTVIPETRMRDFPKDKLKVYRGDEFPEKKGTPYLTRKHRVRAMPLVEQPWFKRIYTDRNVVWRKLSEIMYKEGKKPRTFASAVRK